MIDAFKTIAAPSEGEFKDRGSKFLAHAWPVRTEADIHEKLEILRKAHIKARHHCYAWRLGADGTRYRSNDDGEPSGTAGRPILAQIDALDLRDVLVVVVRYFGGTLLGTSGLINAYREAAAEALRHAEVLEKIVQDHLLLDFDYALMPDVMQAVKKLNVEVIGQEFGDRGRLNIAIRQSETAARLLTLKAQIWKVSLEEAAQLDWPAGLFIQTLSSDA